MTKTIVTLTKTEKVLNKCQAFGAICLIACKIFSLLTKSRKASGSILFSKYSTQLFGINGI